MLLPILPLEFLSLPLLPADAEPEAASERGQAYGRIIDSTCTPLSRELSSTKADVRAFREMELRERLLDSGRTKKKEVGPIAATENNATSVSWPFLVGPFGVHAGGAGRFSRRNRHATMLATVKK